MEQMEQMVRSHQQTLQTHQQIEADNFNKMVASVKATLTVNNSGSNVKLNL
jgi:hypothetical protein